MEQRISLVTLGVADLDRAREFYQALGWTPTGPTDSGRRPTHCVASTCSTAPARRQRFRVTDLSSL